MHLTCVWVWSLDTGVEANTANFPPWMDHIPCNTHPVTNHTHPTTHAAPTHMHSTLITSSKDRKLTVHLSLVIGFCMNNKVHCIWIFIPKCHNQMHYYSRLMLRFTNTTRSKSNDLKNVHILSECQNSHVQTPLIIHILLWIVAWSKKHYGVCLNPQTTFSSTQTRWPKYHTGSISSTREEMMWSLMPHRKVCVTWRDVTQFIGQCYCNTVPKSTSHSDLTSNVYN